MIPRLLIILSGLCLAFGAGLILGTRFEPSPPEQTAIPSNHGYEHGDVVTFSTLIEEKAGQEVLKFDPKQASHQAFAQVIKDAASPILASLSAEDSPIKGLSRINEASRFFEDALLAKISAHPDFDCHIPLTSEGQAQRSGYPDLVIHHLPSDSYAYLDPKLVASGSEESSYRSFYFQPRRKTSKIHHPALHFVIGIMHDSQDGDWTFTHWKLVDLSGMKLKLKSEFSSTNKEMYQPENQVIEGSSTAKEEPQSGSIE